MNYDAWLNNNNAYLDYYGDLNDWKEEQDEKEAEGDRQYDAMIEKEMRNGRAKD